MRRALVVALAACAVASPLAGQAEQMAHAYDLERRNAFSDAAAVYLAVLRDHPNSLTALLGLERVLVPLHREADLAAPAEAFIRSDPTNTAGYPVAMHGWAAAGLPDSVASVASRWALVEPGSETPYREWGNTLLSLRDGSGARRAYLTGRERLGDPEALAGEFALLAAAQNDWETAAREWGYAMDRYPGYRLTARNALGSAPTGEHDRILHQLVGGRPPAARLAAELTIQWGDPAAAYALLMANLPAGDSEALDALRQFFDAARAADGPAAARVRGAVLEQMAERTSGPAAPRMRLEAARAYADGGDAASARRMLTTLAADGRTPPDMASTAGATLVEVLVREGQVDEAERRLTALRATLGAETSERLTMLVAHGWIERGDLDRAETLLANDSTVDALALTGLVRLYRGDLAGAASALQMAGPFAGGRDLATERTALLALIQPIESDSLPAFGAAMLQLARGDSTAAVAGLVAVADGLPPAAGGAEIRLLAGRIEAARGHPESAERLLRAAADSTVPATAPAAQLALARLLISLGRTPEAVADLEHLILAYPGSAVVPQARRLLDAARGGVPES